MKARRLSFVILTATMSFAAVAGAQAQDEEPAPTDESGRPDAPPPGPPQAELAPGAPQAALPPPAADIGFGTPGQFVVSDDMQMALLRRRQTIMGMTTDMTSVQLRPALDYFVARNLSIGGQLRIGYASGDNGVGTTITTLGLVPRIGYNLALSPTSSIWPRVGLGYPHTSYDNGASGAYNFSSYTVTLDVFVPPLFQPVPHFFLGGGPFLTTDLVSKLQGMDTTKTTDIGLMSTIGGYFGS
jgi:hypothetical protein